MSEDSHSLLDAPSALHELISGCRRAAYGMLWARSPSGWATARVISRQETRARAPRSMVDEGLEGGGREAIEAGGPAARMHARAGGTWAGGTGGWAARISGPAAPSTQASRHLQQQEVVAEEN